MLHRFLILFILASAIGVRVYAPESAAAQAAPTPVPLAAPVGLAVDDSTNVVNADGSFVPLADRVVTFSVSWQALQMPGGSYEVEHSFRQFGQPPTAYEYSGSVAASTSLPLHFTEKYPFLHLLGDEEACYRVRAVNVVLGPYAEKCVPLGIADGPGRLPAAKVSNLQLVAVHDPVPGSTARIEVSWESAAGGTATYEVERSVVNGIPLQPGTYEAIATVGSDVRRADGRFAYVEPAPLTGRLICYRVRGVEGGVASGYAPAACAQGAIGRALGAPDVVGHIDNDKRLYVAGRDTTILVSGWIPAFCGGSTVRLSFYTRGGAALVNTVDEGVPSVVVPVNADGTFQVAVPLPKKFSSIDGYGYPGVAGSCLTAPVVGGQVMLGVLDPVANNGFAGTFVIPAAVLGSTGTNPGGPTLGQSEGVLTVFADGVECTTVQLAQGPSLDAEGNVRIHVGGPNQPPACSREGATISFVNGRGQALVETRTLLIGVTQPFANFAPFPPTSGPGVAPLAPVAGNSPPQTPSEDDGAGVVASACGLLLVAAEGTAMARRRARWRASPHGAGDATGIGRP